MELKDFTGRPCSSKVSYEFFPKKKVKIDLEKASEEIKKIAKIEINSKVLLMINAFDKTISIFSNGKKFRKWYIRKFSGSYCNKNK